MLGGENMSKQTDWNNDFMRRTYDRIGFVVPKGRKAQLDERLKAEGKTLSGFLNTVLREYLGVSDANWGITQKPPR